MTYPTPPHSVPGAVMPSDPGIPCLTDIQVAALTGLSVATLRKWRIIGRGPRWYKVAATVRYSLDDVRAWATRDRRGEDAA